jgi:tetratricopeptide (TPR) repeat protein
MKIQFFSASMAFSRFLYVAVTLQAAAICFAQSPQLVPDLASAQKLAAAERLPEAIAAYGAYLHTHPQSEVASVALADCYRRVHNFDEARQILLVARKQHPQSVPVLKSLGTLELEGQSYDLAIEALNSAVRLSPKDLEARSYLASAYRGKGDASSALAQLNRVLAAAPGNQLALFIRAQIYADSGENAKALADAEAVVAARPAYLPALALLAKLLVRQQNCPRAAALLHPSYESHQLDTQSLFILANAFDCSGHPDQAKSVRAEFAAAADADHQRTENDVQSKHLVEQAGERARQNQLAEASSLLQQALDKNPQNAAAYSQKAKILVSTGDLGAAQAAIERALALQPYQPDFLYVSGIVAERQKKWDEALACFQRVTQINPKEADAYFEIGKIRLQQGDRAAALKAFRAAASLEPGDPDYRQALDSVSQPSAH